MKAWIEIKVEINIFFFIFQWAASRYYIYYTFLFSNFFQLLINSRTSGSGSCQEKKSQKCLNRRNLETKRKGKLWYKERYIQYIIYICTSRYFFNMFCNIDFGYLVGQNLLNYQRSFFLLSSWEYKSSTLIPFWKFFHPTRPIIKFHQYGINFQKDDIKFHENVLPTRLFRPTLLCFFHSDHYFFFF